MMKKISLVFLVVELCLCFSCSSASNEDAEEAAIACAQNWLELVDNEHYSES